MVEVGAAVGAAAGVDAGVLGADGPEESVEPEDDVSALVELPEAVDVLEEDPRLSFL